MEGPRMDPNQVDEGSEWTRSMLMEGATMDPNQVDEGSEWTRSKLVEGARTNPTRVDGGCQNRVDGGCRNEPESSWWRVSECNRIQDWWWRVSEWIESVDGGCQHETIIITLMALHFWTFLDPQCFQIRLEFVINKYPKICLIFKKSQNFGKSSASRVGRGRRRFRFFWGFVPLCLSVFYCAERL